MVRQTGVQQLVVVPVAQTGNPLTVTHRDSGHHLARLTSTTATNLLST
jgi:hypothetical protein